MTANNFESVQGKIIELTQILFDRHCHFLKTEFTVLASYMTSKKGSYNLLHGTFLTNEQMLSSFYVAF